jgi:CHAD domain-containing protein
MPYCFLLTDSSVESAVRRIASEELSAILANFSGPATMSPKQVHDTRKHIKKLRSLIRLVRDGFGNYVSESNALRDAARLLSETRDQTVILATFDTLMGRGDAAVEVAALRGEISQLSNSASKNFSKDPEPILHALRSRAEDWRIRGDDAKILLHGLSLTRRNGRAAMRIARREPDAESFHQWRKRTKDLWYQSRLLSPIWPELMKPLTQAADFLGESLGQHHDLSVLAEQAKKLHPNPALSHVRADLTHRITEAQTAIASTAFPLGARLFAGDADEIARQWLSWWKSWRSQAAS